METIIIGAIILVIATIIRYFFMKSVVHNYVRDRLLSLTKEEPNDEDKS